MNNPVVFLRIKIFSLQSHLFKGKNAKYVRSFKQKLGLQGAIPYPLLILALLKLELKDRRHAEWNSHPCLMWQRVVPFDSRFGGNDGLHFDIMPPTNPYEADAKSKYM